MRLSVVAVLIAWIWWDASVSASRLGALGAVLVALLAIGLLVLEREGGSWDRTRLVMVAALGAFVVWNFLSMAWAEFPAPAWNGANRALVYAVLFLLMSLWAWTERELVLVVGLYTLAVAGSGLATVLRVVFASDPGAFLDEGRLATPTGYANGNAAVWMLGVLPALTLASSRELGPLVRALYLASATLLTSLAVLAQSRGWLFGLPIAAIVVLLCARRRLRVGLAILVTAVATGAITGSLLAVFDRYWEDGPAGAALDRAMGWILVASACSALAGVAWAALDRRLEITAEVHRRLAIAGAAAVVAVLGAGLGIALSAVDDPGDWVSTRWEEFTGGYSGEAGSSRFSGSLGADRYQEWRIAALEFTDHPVIGIGSDNYAAPYLERRDDNRVIAVHPHSTPLRILSQLGIVGAILFAVFLGAALWRGFLLRSAASAPVGGVVGAALALVIYWLVQGSLDVFWEVPALAGAAFAFLGAVAAPVALGGGVTESSGQLLSRRAALPIALTALVLAAASLVLTWASAAYTESGARTGIANPEAAYSRFQTAADLNPLSGLPLAYEGLVALRVGDDARARSAFLAVLDREPENWYAMFQLGLLAASRGEYEQAAMWIADAQARNPRDPLVEIARQLVAARAPVDPDIFNDLYDEGVNRESVDWLVERYFQVPPFTEPGN